MKNYIIMLITDHDPIYVEFTNNRFAYTWVRSRADLFSLSQAQDLMDMLYEEAKGYEIYFHKLKDGEFPT